MIRGHTHIDVGDDRIELASIVPDLALSDFTGRIVPFSSLSLEKEIGQGSYASVLKARFQNMVTFIPIADHFHLTNAAGCRCETAPHSAGHVTQSAHSAIA